jgi:hypothetical protein
MDDLAEPVVRGAFRVVLWLIRAVLEALFEYVIETAWDLSKRRSWSGWIPALVVALAGAILAGWALSADNASLSLVCLAIGGIPVAGRTLYVAIVPAVPRRS